MLVVALGWLFWSHRRWPLSAVSHGQILVVVVLHIIGTHYTYANVPIGSWLKDLLHDTRNPYDRVVHFSFGLLLFYPWREQVMRAGAFRAAWASLIAIMIIASLSAVYEIAEWIAADLAAPDDAMAFLATQGDPFDSQKDMAMAIAGASIALLVVEVGAAWRRRDGRRPGAG